jgi:precorrin-4/cobalt-precorrin-4 C11-methyltransferase
VRAAKVTRTALILVGRVFESRDFTDSRLYAADHRHVLRPGKKSPRSAKSLPKVSPLPRAGEG